MRLTLALLILAAGLTPAATQSDCGIQSAWTQCSVSNDGSEVDLNASTTLPGRTDDSPPPAGTARPEAAPDPDARPGPTPQPDCPLNRCDLPYEVVGLPDVTIDDLASFRPAAPAFAGEPEGFGVVGMPMNAVATASEQRIPGMLFDFAVVVRFVPVAYEFDFGDGTTLRSPTGGTTWDRLGQAQFTPTTTSHLYRQRGTFAIRSTVHYAASVDFGGGNWRPVPGRVSASGDPHEVQVVAVHTALVARTCLEDPAGPGC